MQKPITKKILKIIFLPLACSQFALSFASAQNSRDMAMVAAQNSASIQVASAKLKSAEAQALIAGLPISVGLGGGYAWNGASNIATTGDWNLQASINFAGLFGEQDRNRVLASINLERARRSFMAAQIRASKNALELWHAIRRDKASLETASINLELAVLNDRASELRLQSGASNQSERDNNKLALENTKLEFARAQLKLKNSLAFFANILGIDGNATLAEKQTWTAITKPEKQNIEAREDLFEARAAVQGAELDLAQAKRALWPVAKLGANVAGSSGALSFNTDSNLATSLAFNYPNTPNISGTSWGITVGANWGVSTQAFALPALEANLEASKKALAATIKNVQTEIESKQLALAQSQNTLELAQQQFANATENLKRNKTRLEAGVVGPQEIKRAELELSRSLEGIVGAQAEVDLAIAALGEAVVVPFEVR